jgi:DNA-binding NarL/FixJ family response regulator
MEAFGWLSRADLESPLGAQDLELLATTARMAGRDEDYVHGLERAHQAYLDAGEALRAVRCAWWAGMCLLLNGEEGRATGWFGRAQRLLERQRACVERGYLMLTVADEHGRRREFAAMRSTAEAAVQVAERYRDPDLHAMALHYEGRALVRLGRVAEGVGLLDEVMAAVMAGELSPIVTGHMYCAVIDACQAAQALRRAQEWTAAMSRWCDQQPELVAFTGRCLIHRAEIMQLQGSWPDALTEAERARDRAARGGQFPGVVGDALYRKGELRRLRGELAAAEDAYREAARCGREPQPGLALLRLAQGRPGPAAATIRRLASETTEPIERAALLPAYAEIMLAVGDRDRARSACDELAAVSDVLESELLASVSAQARGAVELADGDTRAALIALRQALRAWQELGVPYEAARARVLLARACRALGDDDGAALELEAARATFAQLGAAPDLATADSLAHRRPLRDGHGLTPRELEVLLLVATGETNKAIAARLVLSERTVDRHVSNIYAKLGVSSRAAATGYAHQHGLVHSATG